LEVYVTEAQMGSVAGFVKGYVILEGLKLRFKGVAFGRYGGHNVIIQFMPAASKKIASIGMDPDRVALEVQESIVRGNFTPSPGAKHTDDPVIGPP
jgi:hypothetical protein